MHISAADIGVYCGVFDDAPVVVVAVAVVVVVVVMVAVAAAKGMAPFRQSAHPSG